MRETLAFSRSGSAFRPLPLRTIGPSVHRPGDVRVELSVARTPNGTRASAVALPLHDLPRLGNSDGDFSDLRSDPLDRSRPHVPNRKDSRARSRIGRIHVG